MTKFFLAIVSSSGLLIAGHYALFYGTNIQDSDRCATSRQEAQEPLQAITMQGLRWQEPIKNSGTLHVHAQQGTGNYRTNTMTCTGVTCRLDFAGQDLILKVPSAQITHADKTITCPEGCVGNIGSLSLSGEQIVYQITSNMITITKLMLEEAAKLTTEAQSAIIDTKKRTITMSGNVTTTLYHALSEFAPKR